MKPLKNNQRLIFLAFLLLAVLSFSSLACQAAYRLASGEPLSSQVSPVAEVQTTPAPVQPGGGDAEPTETGRPIRPQVTPQPGTTDAAPTADPHLPTESPTPMPKDLQVRVFEDLWKTVKDVYLYPDFNGLDWDAVHVEYRKKIDDGLTNQQFYSDMREMIDRLGDNHSAFLSPDEAKAQAQEYAGNYNFVGIGVLVSASEDKTRAVILVVFADSPAEKAGLKPRDSIFTADGQAIIDATGAIRPIIRGPAGTQVTLEVQTPGTDKRKVTITRAAINSSMTLPHSVLTSPGGKRVGYIFLMTFNDSTVPASIRDAINEMSAPGPLDGLIIDDRENSGGAVNLMEEVLSYFSKGVVGHFYNREKDEAVDLKKGKDLHGSQTMPLVILVGKGSYSAGEIFPGILQDLGRAYLIGETTNGVVELKYVYSFEDGSQAEIAAESFRPLNHPNTTWEKVGVKPDQEVVSSWDQYSVENDPAVVAALQHIDGK